MKTLLLLLLTLPALAQTPQRTDMAALIGRMPKLPTSTQEALSSTLQANPYQRYGDELQAILVKIQAANPLTIRAQQKALATDAQFKADGVSEMTDDQKIAYARKKQLGGASMDGRMAFAQKMNDPAFQKKFQAMSTSGKMAVMQEMGATPKPVATTQSSNPMQADMTAMMQDPAMRAKWQAMSPAEKQAFIEERKKAKGYDASKRPAAKQADDNGGSFADAIDSPGPATAAGSPLQVAIGKAQALQKALSDLAQFMQKQADSQLAQTNQRVAARTKAQADALAQQEREGMAEAKRQGKTGINWVLTNTRQDRQILLSSSQQQQQIDVSTLISAAREWAAKQAILILLNADYQSSMEVIKYGEAFFNDDSQFQNMGVMAGQQATAIGALQRINTVFDELTNRAAQNQTDLNSNSQVMTVERQLLQSSGG